MRLPREVMILAFISFLSSIGLGIVVPSLPALGADYGVGIAAMSVAISGFAAARLMTNLTLTPILRRMRLQPVLAIGLAFQGLTTITAGLAQDYTSFILLRSISGAGSAAFTIASTALMVAVAPSDRRGRSMSLLAAMTGIGTVSGPALGGLLVTIDPHLPLIVYGSSLCVAAVVTLVFLHRVRTIRTVSRQAAEAADPEAAALGAGRSLLRRLLSDNLFVTVVVCQAVNGGLYYGVRSAILPTYMELIGYTAGFVGLLLTVGAVSQVIASTASGTISDRIGRFPMLAGSYVAAIASFTLFLFADAAVAIAVISFAALGLASGLQQSTAGALLADSPNGRTAAAAGIYWITFDVTAIIGPTVGGIVAEAFGMPWVLIGGIVLLVAALANAVRSWWRSARGRPGAA
ncbi:MFS transporter [Microbacterium sp. LWS13-1.2]|uniref:MFS transporter n=1 Tax=Microbacterium sp. LWS13-1.2 TaxID=3135264 RepID=A0AAU6SBM0_9MICO